MVTYVTRPTSQDFIYALVKKWTSGVSGGLSVPFTIVAIYAPNPNTKLIFALLAVAGMVFASYSVWSGERDERIKTQEALDDQTAKLGRPEITLGLKSDEKGRLWVCLMNYSDRAAVNVKIDDISCGSQTLAFVDSPNQITSGFSPNLQVSCRGDGGGSDYDIAAACILNLKKGTRAFEPLQLAIHYTDIDSEHEWVTFGKFSYNFTTNTFDLEKQWVEKGESNRSPVLTF
jgi:hypothetical protein